MPKFTFEEAVDVKGLDNLAYSSVSLTSKERSKDEIHNNDNLFLDKSKDGIHGRENLSLASEDKCKDGIHSRENPGYVTTRRSVNLVGGISIIIGTMIGSGIFSSAQTVSEKSGSVGMILVTWSGAGVIAMLGALCYAELGTLILESGGEYAYLSKAFGPIAGFTYSWASIIVLRPASLSAICLSCGDYMIEPFFGSDESCFPLGLSKAALAKLLAALVNGESLYEPNF